MSTSNRIIKNTLFLYTRTIVSLVLGVFTTRILLQALGESDFGLYNVVGGAISMAGFLSASMSSATQRFLSYAEGKGESLRIRQYFNNSIIIHWGLAALMVVLFILSGLIFFNGVFNIPEGKFDAAVIVYGSMLVSTVFSITIVPYEAEINAHEDMLFFSILGVADVVIKLGIAVCVLFLHSDKLILYAILIATSCFLQRYVAQIYCRRKYAECRDTDLRTYYNKPIIKEMLSFAGWNILIIASGMISLFGMNVVVNHYFNTDVNAAMGIATQLSGVMMGLSANMLKAVTPVIVKSEGANQHERMLMLSYASCKFSYLIFAFVCIPVLFSIQPILALWLTIVPQWTAIFCMTLIIATLIDQISVALYQSIMAVGRINSYNIARSITNIIPIIVSILMFQYGDFPPYWVIINWGIFKCFAGGIVNIVFSHKLVGLSFRDFNSQVVLPVLLSSAVVAVMFLLLHSDGLQWIINFIIGGFISVPIYFFLAFNDRERKKILAFIPNKSCR